MYLFPWISLEGDGWFIAMNNLESGKHGPWRGGGGLTLQFDFTGVLGRLVWDCKTEQ